MVNCLILLLLSLGPGYRELDWGNGKIYKGLWQKNKMHGKGRLETPEGLYRGEFCEHAMHGKLNFFHSLFQFENRVSALFGTGFGRYDSASGEVYIGEFAENLFNGHGVLG